MDYIRYERKQPETQCHVMLESMENSPRAKLPSKNLSSSSQPKNVCIVPNKKYYT